MSPPTRVLVAALGVLLLPVLAAVVSLRGRTWVPVLDHVVHELLVRDVGTADSPLVGPASTAGGTQELFNHLGAPMLYVLAAAYRLSGSASTGLLVGAAAINAASIAAAVAIARRAGGTALGLLLEVALAVALRSLGLGFVLDPWNGHLPVLPFLLLLVAVWATACGHRWLLPLVAGLGSVLVQSHLSLAVPAAGLVLLATVGLVVAHGFDRRLRHVAGVSVVVVAVCWAPPLLEQATADPGNLGAAVDHLGSGDRRSIGTADALGLLAREAGVAPPWVGAHEIRDGTIDPAPAWWLLLPAAGVAVAAVAAGRRRDREALLLLGTVAATLVLAVPTLASIEQADVAVHHVRWLWPVSLLGVVAVAWTAIRALPADRQAVLARRGPPVALAGVALLSLITWVQRPSPLWPAPPREAEISQVARATVAAVGGAGPVIVRNDDTLEGLKVQTAIQLQLERAGIPVAVPGDAASRNVYGDHRADREPVVEVRVLTGAAGREAADVADVAVRDVAVVVGPP